MPTAWAQGDCDLQTCIPVCDPENAPDIMTLPVVVYICCCCAPTGTETVSYLGWSGRGASETTQIRFIVT